MEAEAEITTLVTTRCGACFSAAGIHKMAQVGNRNAVPGGKRFGRNGHAATSCCRHISFTLRTALQHFHIALSAILQNKLIGEMLPLRKSIVDDCTEKVDDMKFLQLPVRDIATARALHLFPIQRESRCGPTAVGALCCCAIRLWRPRLRAVTRAGPSTAFRFRCS